MDVKSRIQNNIISSLPNIAHGFLELAPRVGKTRIAIKQIEKENSETVLWVTPSSDLRDKDIPSEIKKWWGSNELSKFTIVTYSYLSKVEGNFDKIILDEYQDITEHNSEPLFNGSIKYKSILGLSGTPPEHEEKLDIYKKLKLKPLYTISIDEAVALGILADYEITVITCQTEHLNKDVEVKTKAHSFKTTERKQYEFADSKIRRMMFSGQDIPAFMFLQRMRLVHNSITKLNVAKKLVKSLKGRSLIFASTIEQSKQLSKNLYNSKTDDTDLKKFIAKKLKTLACVNSGGVGFTFKGVDNFVIVQANSNKKGDISQKIARSLLHQGEDYKANIYIICLEDTQDKTWVDKVLSSFNSKKIKYVSHLNLK